jgi:uncharacterized membrane protein YfhO
VKYILSFGSLDSKHFLEVAREGKTILYENKNVLPRSFFVDKVFAASSDQSAINFLFDKSVNLSKEAVVSQVSMKESFSPGDATIVSYKSNTVDIKTVNVKEGFLVLTDSFYPTWKCTIDGVLTKIVRTDYNERGVVVPAGKHMVEFVDGII